MNPKFPKKVKPGDPITAADWNMLIDLLQSAMILSSQNSGLTIRPTPLGTVLKANFPGQYLAVANGNISARSGATAGSGNVYLVTVSGATLATSSISYPVINPSNTTMTSGNGIDSGQYCWVMEYPSGVWIVSPMECS